jgi:hypothetical protein
MNGSASDRLMVLGCIAGIFALGVLCLAIPRRLQRVSIWLTDLGFYPFPSFVRSEVCVWSLRALGVLCIGVTLFLLSGTIERLVLGNP